MQKIKVAYVINDLLVGGAQKLVFDLSRMLDKNIYDVSVYVLYDYEGKKVTLKNKFLENNIEIICLEEKIVKRDFKNLIKTCSESFKNNRPDIVHIHLPNALIVGGVASVINRIPFIIHEHNTHYFHSWKIKLVFLFFQPFSKLTICFAETVEKEVFNSSNIINNIDDFSDQKIITILNGVDVSGIEKVCNNFLFESLGWKNKRESLGIGENQKVIFSAARFVKWKGHHLLVQAFAKFADKNPDTVLVIAGEGPEQEVVENLAKTLSVYERIKFLGGRTDIPELLAVSDIYSLVFDYEKNMENSESLGLAGFEAMSAGLPVLIGDFGVSDLYIENWINGVIVKKWDVEDLANLLDKLLNNENLRIEIGKAGRERVYELLDWGGIIKIYNKIYQKIAKR